MPAPQTLVLPDVVCDLWRAQQRVKAHYKQTKLEFTLDGRLVGDLAEALAMEHFRLLPPPKRTGGVDALTEDGRTVQVEATGKPRCGPAFTPGQGIAELLLFFRIDFEAGTAAVLYNGPEAPIRALLPRVWSGTKVVSLPEVLKLSAAVPASESLS